MAIRIAMSDLGSLRRLDDGAQGVVFAAPSLRMQYAPSLVFKQYKPDLVASLDVPVLESMPAYLESLAFADGMELLSLAAWPCRLVEDRGAVTGFVMPAIPDMYFLQMKKSSGMSREAAEFQHLLNDESFLARRKIDLTDRHRYELLREVARALSVFHRHGIAVGDLSPKNLLFTYDPNPGVYFIDCDAMRFHGRSVIQQVETPGWDVVAVNANEELGTAASDSYKLGLLALRLLTGTQDARNPSRLPSTVPIDIRHLIEAALSADPAQRPTPAKWMDPIDTAAKTAATQILQAADTPVTARPTIGSDPHAALQGITRSKTQSGLSSQATGHLAPALGGSSAGSQTVIAPSARGGKLGWTIIGVAALITAGSYMLTWFNFCDSGFCSGEWGFDSNFKVAGLVPAIAILIYLAVRGFSKSPRPHRSPFLMIAAADSLLLVIYNCVTIGGGGQGSLSYGAYIAIGAAAITLLAAVLSRSPGGSAAVSLYAKGGELGWTILAEAAIITAASYMVGWFRSCNGPACGTAFGLTERPFMIVGMLPAIAILIYLAVRGFSRSRSPRRSPFLITAAIVSIVFVIYNALVPPPGFGIITYGAYIGIAAGIVTLLAAVVIRA
jgi:serine/threonine protein kinase